MCGDPRPLRGNLPLKTLWQTRHPAGGSRPRAIFEGIIYLLSADLTMARRLVLSATWNVGQE